MIKDVFLIMVLAVTSGLLVYIAFDDIRRFKILNVFSLVIAGLYIPVFFLSGEISFAEFGIHMATAAVALVIGFTMFSAGIMGGGDAKLLSAVALWAGQKNILTVLIIASLVGGVLALVYLAIEIRKRRRLRQQNRISKSREADLAPAGHGSLPPQVGEAQAMPRLRETQIPYGVAIAAGHLVLIYTLAVPAVQNIFGA